MYLTGSFIFSFRIHIVLWITKSIFYAYPEGIWIMNEILLLLLLSFDSEQYFSRLINLFIKRPSTQKKVNIFCLHHGLWNFKIYSARWSRQVTDTSIKYWHYYFGERTYLQTVNKYIIWLHQEMIIILILHLESQGHL